MAAKNILLTKPWREICISDSHLQLLEGAGVTCIVAYHCISRGRNCHSCMRRVMNKNTNHHMTSITAFITYIPE